MSKNDTVLFDPGYAPLAIESMGQVGYNYYIFSAIPDVKLKRLNFLTIAKKLEYHLKINVAFYMGCLLWASYIKTFENKEIEGNKLYGEKCEESEYTDEIDFLIDFIENKYPRDYKYFLSKFYTPDERFLPILKMYREFLVLNKGFVSCKNTDEIKLPKSLKKITNPKEINEKIQDAIKKGDLVLLLDYYNDLF